MYEDYLREKKNEKNDNQINFNEELKNFAEQRGGAIQLCDLIET